TIIPDSDLVNTRWMTDLDQAFADGMAIRIPKSQLAGKIDRLVVVGQQDGDAVAGTLELEELIAAHHYSNGLGFLRYGTPTNNTDEERSGFSAMTENPENSSAVEVEQLVNSSVAEFLEV